MERARVAVIVVVVVVSGVAVAAIGTSRGWFRPQPPTDQTAVRRPEQKEARNAARAVELIARAAAEPHAHEAPAPAPRPVAAADSERPAPDLRWTAQADAGAQDGELCGGKVCAANQFCCGPPECGRCASRLTGPRCPSRCP